MSDFGLARLDRLGDPDVLRARAEQAMAGLEIDTRPGAPQEGADPADVARVSVSADGVVVDVSISRRWPEKLAADRLGAAVLDAYHQAENKRAMATTRRTETDVQPEPRPDIDDERWLDRVWATLDEAGRRISESSRPRSPAAQPEEHTVTGPGGYIRLRAVGPVVREIVIDDPGLARRNPDAVAVDVKAAFEILTR